MENLIELVKKIYTQHILDLNDFSSYEEIHVLNSCVKKLEFEKNNPHSYFRDYVERFYDNKEALDNFLPHNYIGFCVRTGGHSGGSCFGDEASYEKADNINLDSDYLDKVLEVIAPDVSYLTYRKIEKQIIFQTEHIEYEYYGNNDIYFVQLIPIQPLLEMLKEKNYLISDEMAQKLLENNKSNKPKI